MDVTTRPLMRLGAVLVLPLLVLVAGCGSDDDGRPDECGRNDQDPRAASLECAETLFTKGLDGPESDELSSLDDQDRIKYARLLCEQAAEATDQDGPRPLRSEFLDDAAQEWSLEPATLEVLARAAEPLCPEEFVLLESLPVLSGQAELDLSVEGAGAVTIEYTTSEGDVATERALAPWNLRIALSQPVDVRLRVTPTPTDVPEGEGAADAGPLRCTITVGDRTLTEAQVGPDGAAFSCDLTRAQVIEATNAPTGGATDVPAVDVPAGDEPGNPTEPAETEEP